MIRNGMAILFSTLLLIAYGATTADATDIRLKRVGEERTAKGQVELLLTGSVDCDRLLKITAFKLRPEAVYSVWIRERVTGKRVPAGLTGKNFFATGSSGSGGYSYVADLANISWNDILIAWHPDGNHRNTESMVVVLKAKLIP